MIKRLPLLLAAVLLAVSLQTHAADVTVIYNKNEPKNFIALLQDALEHTKSEGAYSIKPTDTALPTARMIDEIADNTGTISIMTRGSNIEEEKRLLPIRIPLDKGLLGYRIMLVRKQDLPKFAAIQSVDELKLLRVGQGSRWPDTKILEGAGFKVTKGYYAAGLLRMLNEDRFDMFARATWEATGNLEDAKKQGLDDLVIEPSLAVFYPYPRIFMVSRKGDGPALAARIERGLRLMIKDGSFDKAFNDFFGPAIESTQLRERKIFRVDNKLLSPDTPLDDKSLWFSVDAPTTKPSSKP
ncbi:hypothetical protein Q9Q94_15625 [Uliginosibacterium sp. 31-16]|uniref:hypothetical protein n=1 Tax=Uliginosibacterium sp. 31-16 TaxID=3068315 RepID=UPI00273ECDCD|nr:hypothetical protein [Uliginosibacterium sp. 31-16]MDP5240971.1 hypothetical protein [Uliginosibacterium sp. 31-16]